MALQAASPVGCDRSSVRGVTPHVAPEWAQSLVQYAPGRAQAGARGRRSSAPARVVVLAWVALREGTGRPLRCRRVDCEAPAGITARAREKDRWEDTGTDHRACAQVRAF